MNRLLRALFATMLACAGATPGTAPAQTWPAKPIRVVLPFPPGGGGMDVMARLIGQKITETYGQPVLVENRSGASGAIAGEFVARAAPDGYTFFFTTPGIIVNSLFTTGKLPYDAQKDFTPVTAAVEPVTCMVVSASLPVNNLRELVDHAKKNPEKIFYASNGVASFFHLMGELFNQTAGVSMVHVPYKGAPPVVQDLLTGRIHMAMNSVSSMSAQIRSGKLKVLAVLEGARFRGLPEVPTVGESYPGFEKPASWWAFLGPAALPAPIATRFQSDVARALGTPEIQKMIEQDALTPIANTPEQFAAMYRAGFDVYVRAYKIAGIKPE
jgi:tripartite-type tricarboxylate transporter receptor subunit TctC